MSLNKTDDKLIQKLMATDLSAFHIGPPPKYSRSDEAFAFAQKQATEALGPGFELNADLAEFNYYCFAWFESFDIFYYLIIFDCVFFYVDDHLEKKPTDYQEMLNCLETRTPFSGHGVVDKWVNFTLKLGQEILSEDNYSRLLKAIINAWIKYPEVAKCYSEEWILSDQKLVDLRLVDCGSEHQLSFIRFDAKVELTEELKRDPDWNGINRYGGYHLAIVNDLYSLRREAKTDKLRYNYVYVKMRNNKLTPQQAVDTTIEDVREWDRLAHVCGDNLKKRKDPKIDHYVRGVYAAMIGNHYWSTYCARYNSDKCINAAIYY